VLRAIARGQNALTWLQRHTEEEGQAEELPKAVRAKAARITSGTKARAALEAERALHGLG
jgi:hypothetical protein